MIKRLKWVDGVKWWCYVNKYCYYEIILGEFLEFENEIKWFFISLSLFFVVCEMELYKGKNLVKYFIILFIFNYFLLSGILKIFLEGNVMI